MKVEGIHFQSVWFDDAAAEVRIIDQTRLPHFFSVLTLDDLDAACHAIRAMQVRGAPLIGATAAFGLYLALRQGDIPVQTAARQLAATRPTAVNLQWALARVMHAVAGGITDPVSAALAEAKAICEEDIANCYAIGEHGVGLIEALSRQTGGPVNILTHCNAGWLATVDWGTALAPVYRAWEKGIDLHVWVDETRPRNQGASLTAWELVQQGIPHTVISDNAGGHLMQSGRVDLCLVGSDRTTFRGNVCNKIGTYLKALAARDNRVPFYSAVPVSSIDWDSDDVPIEERGGDEVATIQGLNSQGELDTLRLTPAESPVSNYAFDVTPGHLVTALITELGIFPANASGLAAVKKILNQHSD